MEVPDVEEEWEQDEEDFEEAHYCEVCEEEFDSQHSYEKHLSEHKVCGLDGCQYTAHANMIEKHIETTHLTGLYEKIRSGNSPEEIAKWLEDRKVKYPTKENVQKRYEKQLEMFKRGERIGERKNRFGKDRTRFSGPRQKKATAKRKRKVPKTEKKESLIDEKCDWNGTMFPFKGTKELFGEEKEKEMSDYDDEEWGQESSNSKPIEIKNALGALMGAYMSDDEAPTEQKIEKEQTAFPIEDEKKQKSIKTKKRKIPNRNKRNKVPRLEENKVLQDGFSRIKFFKRRITLLEKLLDSEIRHERNILLQCVQYVVSNNFFD